MPASQPPPPSAIRWPGRPPTPSSSAFSQVRSANGDGRLEPRRSNFAMTGHDPRRNRRFVDILFLALKGGSGATWGADGYDHIGLINCAGGIQAQDYEMFDTRYRMS